MELTTVLVAGLTLAVGLVVGLALGARLGSGSATREARHSLTATADQAVVKDSLDRLHQEMRELQTQRVSWQSQLRQQVDDVRHSTDLLRRETHSLSSALRRPTVRGRWGELHLRRSVELAGLVAHCDFEEQVGGTGADGAGQRPDLVVRLAGQRNVVVDAKVPLDAFLDSTETDDEDERLAHLRRHGRQLRAHVDVLAGKAYWRGLPRTPEFVVLFVPGEAFLSAALETDTGLLEYAAERRVILSTPTTLIALLRTVALGWSQEGLAERAEDILRLGRELHERLGTLGTHVDKVGRSLTAAVTAYNQAVGSLEGRVLVSARKLTTFGVTQEALPSPALVDVAARVPSAEELVEDDRAGVRTSGPAIADRYGVASEDSA